MGSLFVVDHPLVKHKLTFLRSRFTDVHLFRELMQELSMLLAYEATRGVPVEETTVETPPGKNQGIHDLRAIDHDRSHSAGRVGNGRRVAEIHADGQSGSCRPVS
jgi:hypothetical protein